MAMSGSSHQPLEPPRGGVAIRMYRQGLGDCFLLAFDAGDQRPAYVLVDCGVHRAQSEGSENMRRVLSDVIETTGGRLDLVVATHEHTDHLSGFVAAADYLSRGELAIEHLWLAWTEDPEDPLAQQLRGSRDSARRAIQEVIERLEDADEPAPLGLRQRLAGADSLQMDDELDRDAQSLALQFDRDPEKTSVSELALMVLQKSVPKQNVRYLRPGMEFLPIPRAASARAYVLGPPTELALLRKSKPSSGDRQETYLTSDTGLASFAAAVIAARGPPRDGDDPEDPGEVDRIELSHPFSADQRIPYRQAKRRKLFQQLYGFDQSDHPHQWRQIENEWLYAADQLALDLDNHTNNTSIALALEFGKPGRGRVLLFPADAQVGNWLSWRTLSWKYGRRTITLADLFSRTVLYKVGHHASHNATLKRDREGSPYGLELIPEGLIALIPVDEAAASKLPGWNMPDPDLYEALLRKTGGNILRADNDPQLRVPRQELSAVPGVEGATWRRSQATKSGSNNSLFYDVYLG